MPRIDASIVFVLNPRGYKHGPRGAFDNATIAPGSIVISGKRFDHASVRKTVGQSVIGYTRQLRKHTPNTPHPDRIHTTDISSTGELCFPAYASTLANVDLQRVKIWAACVRRAYAASHIPIPHPASRTQRPSGDLLQARARALLTQRLTVPQRDHHRAQPWVCLRSGRGVDIVEDAPRRHGGLGEAPEAHAPHAEQAALTGHAIRDAKAVGPYV